MELISIIIPVYNVERYLKRCVDSIIHQTYENLEIILVDDGSSDRSGSICDEYKEHDNRIRVIHKENGGLGFARNSGLEIATGEYVAFIDGDDYIGKTHIEAMLGLIKETATDTCMSGHTKVFSGATVEHKNVCAGRNFYDDVKEQILPRMCGADNTGNDYIEMSACMVLFSNKIIQENKLRFVSEREFISEDLVFDFSYYPLSKGVCCGDMVDYYYCDNEGSLTTKYRPDRFSSEVKLYKEIRKKATELGIENLVTPRLNTTLIAIARYSIKLEEKFKSKIGKATAKKHIKIICNDELLAEVISEYDDKGTKKSSRAVNWLIKRKAYSFLWLTMKLKNRFNI